MGVLACTFDGIEVAKPFPEELGALAVLAIGAHESDPAADADACVAVSSRGRE